MLYRTMFVLGIVAFIAVLIFTDSGPPQPFEPIIPSFINPFDEGRRSSSALVDAPAYSSLGTGGIVTWVGCNENETCLATDDLGISYVQTNKTTPAGGNNIRFNWTISEELNSLIGDKIQSIRVTVSCYQPTLGVSLPFLIEWNGVYTSPKMVCAKDGFKTIIAEKNSNGTGTFGNPGGFSFDGYIYAPYDATTDLGILQFSYLRMDVSYGNVVVTGCSIPEGAWFPQLDEVGCAIRGVGETIWKGLVFIFNGLIYIGGWLILLGVYISNGLAVIIWLFAIPDLGASAFGVLIQGFVDVVLVVWIGVLGIEAFKIIKPFGG